MLQGIGQMNTELIMRTTPDMACLQDGVDAADFHRGVAGLSAANPAPIAGHAAGIALAFAGGDSQEREDDRFTLLFVDGEGATVSALGPFEEDEVVAIWRDLSQRTGLPRMIRREDGEIATVSRQIGRLALGTTRMRRRHGSLGERRPRFLTRRKTGRLPARPQIHRGESEIIARS